MATFRRKLRDATRFLRVPHRRPRQASVRALEALRERVETSENRAAGWFDADWYRAAYPDVAREDIDPFVHYMRFGYRELRQPGPNFNSAFYMATYAGVVAADANALLDFLDRGRFEGRYPNLEAMGGVAREPHHMIVKAITCLPGDAVVVLVAHVPTGRLKPHVLPYMRRLAAAGLKVLLVAMVDRPLELDEQEIAAADGIIVRVNVGYDFGAWAHACAIEPALLGAGLLVLANDSVIATDDDARFGALMDRVRADRGDIVALTASHEYGWHTQSYFLAFKPRALASWAVQRWFRGIVALDDKDAVIRSYEVPFAAQMQAAGLHVSVLFRSAFPANPALFGWRELLAQGFPFIKVLLLCGAFPEAETEGWADEIGAYGFSVATARATVQVMRFAELPAGDSDALLLDEALARTIEPERQLRIAFFGPWNYDVGLGAASREAIAALRRTGARLNLYPIEPPFHVHRQICPSAPITDFGGHPDIAVIHLNPDAWHALSPEQQAIISSARRRIGYWVWETDTLPDEWTPRLGAVDRVWAPSAYCADMFAAQTGLPVDVVPHAVPVPAKLPGDRAAMLTRFGLAADARVILYVFDSASYLIRKNPMALVRAFAASGLSAAGWVLLLKTKHLHDRAGDGAALAALAAQVPGVVLTETALGAAEVTTLIAAADIYASPHCSEGFGLTVAEAMALGKPTIATDFGGTRDFLDASTGYPVAWSAYVLEEDHGHYRRGQGWATIDEAALAQALTRAAAAVTAGDDRIGTAARARISDALAYDTVAAAMTASFAATAQMAGKSAVVPRATQPHPPAPLPEPAIDLALGVPFAALAGAAKMVPVALADDLAWPGGDVPAGDEDDWLIFAPGTALAAPRLLDILRGAVAQRSDAVLFYGDDVATGGAAIDRVRLKPEFDRALLVAQDFIGAPVIVRRDVLAAVGGIKDRWGSAALFDLVMRVADAGHALARIPQVLIGYVGPRPAASLADRRAVLTYRARVDEGQIEAGLTPGLLAARWRFVNDDAPQVTICIPTCRARRPRGGGTYVEALLAAIATADWPMARLNVVVGDDIVAAPDWAARDWPYRLERIATPRGADAPFNYARKMNLLWRAAEGDVVVFMNDDVIPESKGWLSALAGFAIQDSVGGVGARLLYSDGALQHAGIYPACGTVVHAWAGLPAASRTCHDWALAQRAWSMVTGAVFATRRTVLDQVDGFDEAFSLEFNDIDLCLRIRTLGYRVIYNPDAAFIHAEKASRGGALPPGGETALFLTRWSRWLAADPASHPLYDSERVDLAPWPGGKAWYRAG